MEEKRTYGDECRHATARTRRDLRPILFHEELAGGQDPLWPLHHKSAAAVSTDARGLSSFSNRAWRIQGSSSLGTGHHSLRYRNLRKNRETGNDESSV